MLIELRLYGIVTMKLAHCQETRTQSACVRRLPLLPGGHFHRFGFGASMKTADALSAALQWILRAVWTIQPSARAASPTMPAVAPVMPGSIAAPGTARDTVSLDHQAARLTGVVAKAIAHGERAVALHGRASRRIDAALYDLDELRRELSTVVDMRLLQR